MLNLPGPRTLLLASPNMADGTGWWRMIPPWNALRENTPHLSLASLDMALTPPTWPPIGLSHVAIVNRPHLGQHLSVIDTAAASGIPSIVDYDDCLWELPETNQAHDQYGDQERIVATIAASRAAVVTVTTEAMGDYIRLKIAPDADVRVIPNAFPEWYTWPTTKRQKILLWRGGDSHIADLEPHYDAIVRVLERHPDWRLVTVGKKPLKLHARLGAQAEHIRRTHVSVFHRWMRTSCAAAMIVPLEDNMLNRCKSNIAWMEGTLAGAAVMAPRWPEFDRPGVFRYEDFEESLGCMLDSDLASHVALSQTYIDDCLRHRHTNVQRAEILAGLLR